MKAAADADARSLTFMQFSPSHVPVMIAGMVRVMDQESSGVNIHYRACEYKFAPATRLGVARHRVSSRSGVDGVSDRGKQPPAGYRDARTSFAKCCVRPLGIARCCTAYPGTATKIGRAHVWTQVPNAQLVFP